MPDPIKTYEYLGGDTGLPWSIEIVTYDDHLAALAAAVQAERERVIKEIERLKAVVEKYRPIAYMLIAADAEQDAETGESYLNRAIKMSHDTLAFDRQTLGGQQGGEGKKSEKSS